MSEDRTKRKLADSTTKVVDFRGHMGLKHTGLGASLKPQTAGEDSTQSACYIRPRMALPPPSLFGDLISCQETRCRQGSCLHRAAFRANEITTSEFL